MAQDNAQERTEAPTIRRREEARNKGQTAQSADLSNAAILVIGFVAFWFTSSDIGTQLKDLMRTSLLGLGQTEWSVADTVNVFGNSAKTAGRILLPILGPIFFAAVISVLIQVGPKVSFEPLKLDWARLSPTNGWSKFISMRSVMRAIMLVLKIVIVSFVVVWVIRKNRQVFFMTSFSLESVVAETWQVALLVGLIISAFLFAAGFLDFFFQRFKHEQDLKMSKQEIRDEQKQQDGDPNIKARIRKLQRESRQNRQIRNVPMATAIVTNPTHISVAIQFERGKMAAPKVIAKGKGAFAMRIRRVAKEHGVPILERKPLARALYASVEVDQEIPQNLYQAMAEVLAHIYKLKRAG